MNPPLKTPPLGPVLAVCGWSGSGKTTVLRRVIPELVDRGLAVAVVKHDAHGIQVDPKGKDSDRLFAAGADVHLRGPGQSLVRERPRSDGVAANDLHAVLQALLQRYDIVLVEGHKGTPLPKIWVAAEDGAAPPPEVTEILKTLPWDSDRPEQLLRFIDSWLPRSWRAPVLMAGILIGGKSARMGSPKQLLEFDGMSFLERTVRALAPHAESTVLLGSGPVPAACAELPRLPDPPGLRGPLAGILGAMRWAPAAQWILAGCDQPMIEAPAVRWLLDQRAPGMWAILPRLQSAGVEPLFAAYDPRARSILEDLQASGRLAPSALATHPRVLTPEPPTALHRAWRNINTPQDLEELQ